MSQENLSLKQRIAKMADDEEEIVPEEFSNLILDDTPIAEITAQDKEYLNNFVNLEKLCMNATGLKNLSNMPDKLKIVRVSIASPLISCLLVGAQRQQNIRRRAGQAHGLQGHTRGPLPQQQQDRHHRPGQGAGGSRKDD
jgi:hypothetical protein